MSSILVPWHHHCLPAPWLVDQHDDQSHDDQDQEQDTLPPARVRLVSLGLFQLPLRRDKLTRRLLYIILHRIQHRPLFHDEVAEVAEEVGQLGDGRRNLGDLVGTRIEVDVEGGGGLRLGLKLTSGLA